MRIIKTGHSEIHPRQSFLTSEIKKSTEILSVCPDTWHDEEHIPEVNTPLNTVYPDGYNNPEDSTMLFMLDGFEDLVDKYNPDIIYAMQEPYTIFAYQCRENAIRSGAKLVLFTWENIVNMRLPKPFCEIEEENLSIADIVICGNKGAEDRVHSINPDVKTEIIPQTGINTDIFKPIPVKNRYDVGYFGRFVPQKTQIYKEFLIRNWKKYSSLTIGGRGDSLKIVGEYNHQVISWVEYLSLPIWYNSLKCFLTLPWNYKGYNEQFNYTIAEALSCGIPVVTTDNGSIPEIYYFANNVFLVKQGLDGLNDLEEFVEIILSDEHDFSKLGREWVIKNLSLDHISKRYIDTFKKLL